MVKEWDLSEPPRQAPGILKNGPVKEATVSGAMFHFPLPLNPQETGENGDWNNGVMHQFFHSLVCR